MGADASWLIEAKIEGTWQGFAQSPYPCMARDYALFGLVNGVRAREGVEPLIEPRGFPTDEPNNHDRPVISRGVCLSHLRRFSWKAQAMRPVCCLPRTRG